MFGDRGSLEIGKRADFITVHDDGILPQLSAAICRGDRMAELKKVYTRGVNYAKTITAALASDRNFDWVFD